MDLNDNELEEWGSFLEKNDEESLSEKLNDIDSQEPDDEQEEENESETDTEDESPEEEVEEEEKPKKAEKKSSKKPEKEPEPEEETIESALDDDDDNGGVFQNITDYFVENKLFSTIDPSSLKNITSLDDFSNAIEAEVRNRVENSLSLQQKRINAAMGVGMPNDDIAKFEKYKYDIESYTDDVIDDVIDDSLSQKEQDFISNRNAGNRKTLIMMEYKMRGYSAEKAERMYKASINSGSDVDDAKDARAYILSHINDEYQKFYNEARRKKDMQIVEHKKNIDNIKNSIKNDSFLNDLNVPDEVRDKIFVNAFVPSYKDRQGNVLSTIQAYRMQNPYEYDKMFSVFYTLTNGFTECDKFLSGKVKKEVNKANKDFEKKILASASTFTGGMKVVGADTSKKKSKDIIDILNMGDFKFENNF